VAASLLGIAVLGFLLFQSSGADQPTAKNGENLTQAAAGLPGDSSQDRVKTNSVAKLNRSAGATTEPARVQPTLVKQDQQATPVKAIANNTAKTDTGKSTIAKSPKPTQLVTTPTPRQSDDRSAKSNSTARSDSTADTTVPTQRLRLRTPLRRNLNRVKSAKVAAVTKPVSGDKYSAENPDPSELLSQALDSNVPADTQLKVNEPSIVMPPVDLTEGELAAPKIEPADMMKKAEMQDNGSATKMAATDKPEASSIVTGELMSDSIQSAPKKTVRIINPASNPLPVWFLAEQRKIQLMPGQRYETSTEQDLLVRFARGGDLGVDRISTSEGDWVFSVTHQDGWKLTRN